MFPRLASSSVEKVCESDPRLSLVTQDAEPADRLHVSGELDVFFAPRLQEVIDRHDATGRALHIDLRACRYMDSTILSVLVRAAKRYGSRLTIAAPESGAIARILSITQLDRHLPIV